MLEVQNLVKMYGRHKAVDNLSFTAEEGKIYGFLGPNGAGKSTTMNIMTGYLGATRGQVIIHGHDILKEPDKAKRCIGYLPEQPPLYPEMTVAEYLRFVSELKKVPGKEREDQIYKVSFMTRLKDVENRLIQNLSKGYKQRVGLAQAILGFPEIIILDEPTVGLDPKQIIEIREMIRKLAGRHTIILSSHILAEVREVCDHIMIISDGEMVASDTPENLEKRISGAGHIEIQARAEKERLNEILCKIPDILSAEYREEGGGVVTALIESREGRDTREELFHAFAAENLPLMTLTLAKTSLEEVFLELTQGDRLKNLKHTDSVKGKDQENTGKGEQ